MSAPGGSQADIFRRYAKLHLRGMRNKSIFSCEFSVLAV